MKTDTRKTITIDGDLYDDLAVEKRDGETWTEYIRRRLDAAPDDECDHVEVDPETIDTIANRTARRTVDEIELLQR